MFFEYITVIVVSSVYLVRRENAVILEERLSNNLYLVVNSACQCVLHISLSYGWWWLFFWSISILVRDHLKIVTPSFPIFTVSGVLLNLLLLYAIRKFTRKSIGSYKYLQATFAAFDVVLTMVHAIVQPVRYHCSHQTFQFVFRLFWLWTPLSELELSWKTKWLSFFLGTTQQINSER